MFGKGQQFYGVLPLRRLRLGHFCRCEHIFNENAVADRWVADHDVRHRSDELAVLNDRAAAQECGQ